MLRVTHEARGRCSYTGLISEFPRLALIKYCLGVFKSESGAQPPSREPLQRYIDHHWPKASSSIFMTVVADGKCMSSAASSLSEPHVLAHAKRRLFPDEADDENTYAVVDT
jgi:hypothetical protein